MCDLRQPHCQGPAGVKGQRSGASLWCSDVEVGFTASMKQASGTTPPPPLKHTDLLCHTLAPQHPSGWNNFLLEKQSSIWLHASGAEWHV